MAPERDELIRKALCDLYTDAIGTLMFQHGQEMPKKRERIRYWHRLLRHPKSPLVGVEEFARHDYFWGMGQELYPEIVPDLVELNSGKYTEAVLTGGIGSAKSTIGTVTCGYQLYLVSRIPDPHELFRLERSSEIVFIFQNITAALSETVGFERFKERVLRSPYFRKYFPAGRHTKSQLRFPNRIVVKTVSGTSTAAIGQNVIGGLLDEVNHMAVISGSTKAFDAGVYDQALEIYNAIARRRKSRFLQGGAMPGILCIASSKKYPGQFTDKKVAEREADIARYRHSPIFLYDRRMWDVKPRAFGKARFRVFVGDPLRRPRILNDTETLPDEDAGLVCQVPEEFRRDFEVDIVNALREVAGVSHITRSPFFTNPSRVAKMFTDVGSIFSRDVVEFSRERLEILPGRIRCPELPRWVHIDLAATGDSAGLAVGYCPGFADISRGDTVETLPRITYDGVLEIRPPRDGEISFEMIRRIVYALTKCGLTVGWVSLDSWQASDTVQLLRQKGFCVDIVSIDRTSKPANMFKAAVNDGRVACPYQKKLHRELRELQVDHVAMKVDHLPGGSKDLSDAVMGVCYGLSMRTEIWRHYDVPLRSVPQSMMDVISKNDGSWTSPASDSWIDRARAVI